MMKLFNSPDFEDMVDICGVGGTIAFLLFFAILAIACPFLWALVYQLVWNFGVVWFAAQLGATLPAIGYWMGMLLYLSVRFIRHILTPKVKVNLREY